MQEHQPIPGDTGQEELRVILRGLVACLLVATATFVAFVPALKGEFLSWDDQALFTDNMGYRGLSVDHLLWMFNHAVLGHYHPITWITFGIDYTLWGMNPLGYHLTSLLFHAANAALVYVLTMDVLLLLRPDRPARHSLPLAVGAATAAMFFAVHPLRVESVAWITERRDVVSLFFLLLCVRAYLRFGRGGAGARRAYWTAVGWLTCSLLSKAWAITAPIVLLVLDFYPLKRARLERTSIPSRSFAQLLLEKVPFAVVSGAAAAIAWWAQTGAGMETLERYNFWKRLAQVSYGIVFYLKTTLLPISLRPLHEIPMQFNPFETRFIASAVAVIALAALLFLLRRRLPSLTVCAVLFFVIASPILGFAQTGPQLVADRYSYISCIPWAMLAGVGVAKLFARSEARRTRASLLAGITLAVVVLASLTWRQCGVWRDSWSLWTYCLKMDPENWHALNNLGLLHVQNAEIDKALEYFHRTVDINPGYHGGWANVGLCYAKLGRQEEAVRNFRQALRCDPMGPELLLEIANGLSVAEAYDDALPVYPRIIERTPDDDAVYLAYAATLDNAGRKREAIEQFKKGVDLLASRLRRTSQLSRSRAELVSRLDIAIHRLADLLTEAGEPAQARAYRQKLEEI